MLWGQLARHRLTILLAGVALGLFLLLIPLEFLDGPGERPGAPGDMVAHAYVVISATPTATATPAATSTAKRIPTATARATDHPSTGTAGEDHVPIPSLGFGGTGNGQFRDPSGIAIDSAGNVYVADTNNYRIQKLTSTGTFLTAWGSYGSGNGRFYRPSGIAIDSADNVFVADEGSHRVQKFTSMGSFITAWGSNGSGNGQFNGPSGIALDSADNVYVADFYNHRIQKFSSSGTFLMAWGGPLAAVMGSSATRVASRSIPRTTSTLATEGITAFRSSPAQGASLRPGELKAAATGSSTIHSQSRSMPRTTSMSLRGRGHICPVTAASKSSPVRGPT